MCVKYRQVHVFINFNHSWQVQWLIRIIAFKPTASSPGWFTRGPWGETTVFRCQRVSTRQFFKNFPCFLEKLVCCFKAKRSELSIPCFWIANKVFHGLSEMRCKQRTEKQARCLRIHSIQIKLKLDLLLGLGAWRNGRQKGTLVVKLTWWKEWGLTSWFFCTPRGLPFFSSNVQYSMGKIHANLRGCWGALFF